ncbi:hypothetical protein E1258_03765 [Micromonospora sp. KC207]|uniref:hypothetical protein n=1 Tax=Micromonospora sp. KC207 TaxID=2530377 RepID=UPI00104C973E|nr:hypothetical protein [Micromonospora sp. KC207]TDC66092.1 hypothetical protein E1258_03765 [Micromonospora sp. KC207]
MAEGFELADEATGLAVLVDMGGVVVRAEVDESGCRVGQDVPDDRQDGSGDRDQGSGFAAAFDQAPVAFAEEGVGAGDCGGVTRF